MVSARSIESNTYHDTVRNIGGHSFVLGMIFLSIVGACGFEIAILTDSFRAGAILLVIAMVEVVRRFPTVERWEKEITL